MKRGWLLYTAENAAKNEWFISRLRVELAGCGVELALKILPPNDDFDGAFVEKLPDFAVVRSIRPKANEWLEGRGVRTFNNAKTASIACDKWQTYRFCKERDIPVLPTWREKPSTASYPLVMKTTDGHGGAEVFWLNDESDLSRRKERLKGREYILQAPCDRLGKDMRIYAIGGEPVGAVLRSSDADFRSNFSLGGRVEKAEPSEEQRAIVERLYEELRFDYIGVDFLPHGGGWVLNELEDAAGARMLYACSDIDIVKLYARHILNGL
ncbi:MAG: ATP-grasp domain-containing protein [Clostridia bacterium]|nr:ATP-grasp domain-containing protein [Clostridia bacterium]